MMNNALIHLLPALRQYRHNDSPELLMGYDYTEVNKVYKVLQDKIAELEKERAVRDLRQQAIGVSKAAKYLSTDNYDEYQDFTKWLNEEADELEQE